MNQVSNFDLTVNHKNSILVNAEIRKQLFTLFEGNTILQWHLSVFPTFIHQWVLLTVFSFQLLTLQFSPRKLVKTSLVVSP